MLVKHHAWAKQGGIDFFAMAWSGGGSVCKGESVRACGCGRGSVSVRQSKTETWRERGGGSVKGGGRDRERRRIDVCERDKK